MRNIKFKNAVALSDKRKIIGVAIDPAKEFHRVIIFDFMGKIIGKPFSIDIFKSGYTELKRKIIRSHAKINAVAVHIAIESTGTCSDNLVNHLWGDYRNIVYIPPLAVANNRKQKLIQYFKTDDVDCGAIGDLLIRGEFIQGAQQSLLYYKLKNLVYWRERKLGMKGRLKNQINDRLHKIYPGINSDFDGRSKLYTDPENGVFFRGLLESNMVGQDLLETSNEKLFEIFG